MNFANTGLDSPWSLNFLNSQRNNLHWKILFPQIYPKFYLNFTFLELKAWTSGNNCISICAQLNVLLWDLRIFCWLVVASATKPRPLQRTKSVKIPINRLQGLYQKLPMKNFRHSLLVFLFVGPPFVNERIVDWWCWEHLCLCHDINLKSMFLWCTLYDHIRQKVHRICGRAMLAINNIQLHLCACHMLCLLVSPVFSCYKISPPKKNLVPPKLLISSRSFSCLLVRFFP